MDLSAIGKRKGAWNLSEDAPESNRAFLLNHLISQLLPPKGGEYNHSNSDPITGQAAWFDLRVRVEKAHDDRPGTVSEPKFPTLPNAPNLDKGHATLRIGKK